ELRISADMELADFRRDDVDVGVRFGGGIYPGLRTDKLFDDSVVPMCSPCLLSGKAALGKPGDLAHVTLLHDDSLSRFAGAPDWASWLKAAKVEEANPNRGLRFSHTDHALQAAIDGLGVVLGRRVLAADDLAAGRLAVPFELE